MRDRLDKAGVGVPSAIHPDGTIIEENLEEGLPRIGVWLWPDNESPGELENFVASMIPGADSVWPLAQDYIARIPEGDRKFASGKVLRAEVYAWLAARKEPRQMGSAITPTISISMSSGVRPSSIGSENCSASDSEWCEPRTGLTGLVRATRRASPAPRCSSAGRGTRPRRALDGGARTDVVYRLVNELNGVIHARSTSRPTQCHLPSPRRSDAPRHPCPPRGGGSGCDRARGAVRDEPAGGLEAPAGA